MSDKDREDQNWRYEQLHLPSLPTCTLRVMRILIAGLIALLISTCILPEFVFNEAITKAEPTRNSPFPLPSLVKPTPPPTSDITTTPTLHANQAGLNGWVFFDYNGNGLRDEDEPGIPGVQLCLNPSQDGKCEYSASDGAYRFEGLIAGVYHIYLTSPNRDPDKVFSYITLFEQQVELPSYRVDHTVVPIQILDKTTIQKIEKSLTVEMNGLKRQDIALTQGPLTDIFSCSDRLKISKFHGYDHDPQRGAVRSYLGKNDRLNHSDSGPAGTEDNHYAVDWGGRYEKVFGLAVRAAAPGVVSFAGYFENSQGTCLAVNIAHPGLDAISGYVHLEQILVRDRQLVERGQIIGTLGMSCTTWPHVHFFLRVSEDQMVDQWQGSDPFRDILDPHALNWWTVDNQPTCLEELGE